MEIAERMTGGRMQVCGQVRLIVLMSTLLTGRLACIPQSAADVLYIYLTLCCLSFAPSATRSGRKNIAAGTTGDPSPLGCITQQHAQGR